MTEQSEASASHPAFERHYRISELVEKWQFSNNLLYDVFKDEPGVLKYGKKHRDSRHYISIRIPESVALRVYERLVRKAKKA